MSSEHCFRQLRRYAFSARIFTLFLWALCAPLVLQAQVPEADAQPLSAGATLADRQMLVRDRVNRLEDRMFQLSQVLSKTEPENAGRLMDGLSALRGKQIAGQLDQIIQKLGDEKFSDAVDAQHAVARDLQALLKLLLQDREDLEQRKEEMDRLDAIRKSLENIIQEQEKEKSESEEAKAARQRAEALDAAAKKLKNVIRKQETLNAKTDAAEGDLRDVASEQATLRADTEALAQQLESLSDPKAQSSRTSDSAGQDGKQGNSGAAQPEEAAKKLRAAADNMQSAEESLNRGEASSSAKQQKQATERLKEALKQLEQEALETRDEIQLDEQAEAQRKTAEKTKGLLQKMNEAKEGAAPAEAGQESGGESGQQGGKQGAEGSPQKGDSQGQQSEQEPGEQDPGQEGVEQAVPLQEGAADDLEEDKLDEAIKKQEQALKKLKNAQEELDDRLDQLRKEQQEELLAALESRFRAMLGRQLQCNKVTARLADLGQENWKRSDQLELAELSQKQRWVGDQAEEALVLLVEEGTTVVFPQLVEQVRDDGRDAADRLAAADAGETTRMIQTDLEQILRDIIEAIKKKQQDLESGESKEGSPDGNPPLLPGSAELKLLRACQLRVNASTERLIAQQARKEASAEESDSVLKRLAKRQRDVTDMAKDMHESMRSAQ